MLVAHRSPRRGAGAARPAAGFLLCFLAAAAAAQPLPRPLAQWRAEIARVHALADNDAVRAQRQAALLQALPAGAGGADRARALNLLALTELHLARTEAAGEHAERALALAGRQGDRVGQAQAELVIAMNTVNQGRLERMAEAITHAVALLDGAARPDLQAEATVRKAMMYIRFGIVDESVGLCVQSLEGARRGQVPLALALAHQCMALTYTQSDHQREAQPHYASMRAAARAAGSKLLEAHAVVGLGVSARGLGDLRAGEALARQAARMYREIGVPFHLASCLHGLAEVLSQQGRHAEALRVFGEVVDTFERHPNRLGLWWALTGRGAVHGAMGRPAAARRDVEASYRLAVAIGLDRYIGESVRQLGALAARRGEHRRAYAYALEAAGLATKMARDKTSARVTELTARHEAEGRRRRIEELTGHNVRQQAELERRAIERRWLWTVLAGSGALLVLIAAILLRLRRSHALVGRLNAELERKVQERTAALRQQGRYLRVLIDTLPWRVWFKDTGGRYLAVNRALAATWGRSVEETVGLSDADIAPALAGRCERDDREVMASRQARSVEERWVAPHGPVWMEIYKAPVLEDDGSVLGTVGFARDISERKLAEGAREAALAEAQRLARLRSEFLAQMSHELRTPLNGILGYAQILGRDAALGERQRASVAVIEDSGQHLLTMINDLLDSAKIEAGKLELDVAAVPLRQALAAVAEVIRVKAGLKELAFHCEIGAAVPAMVQVDGQRLRQALLNLLSNAVKFTERGAVSLRVRAVAAGRLRFEVADTGVGIEAGDLERIFEPFEQAGAARQRHGGTGLGLAISRQFVRLLGGDIAVESAPGRGCRFWFELSLPVLEAAPPPAAAPAAPAPPEAAAGAPLLAPPPAEMAILHRLAQLGDMRGIEERAGHLARLDWRYRPFAARLRRLAKGYQSLALLRLVEQHLAPGPGSGSGGGRPV